PHALDVLADRAVGAEAAHAGDVEDRHARPGLRLGPRTRDLLLALHVRAEVGEDAERVVIDEVSHERLEEARLARREAVAADHLEEVSELTVVLDNELRAVAALLERRDLLGRHAEEEEVLLPDLLADLYVRAVERADRKRAVHRELHVAG